MFKQEDEGIHIKSLDSLIRTQATLARDNLRQVETDLDKFEKGDLNDGDLSNFNSNIQELELELEHIKIYVQREEKKHLGEFELFLNKLIKTNILNHLGKGKKKVKKLFDETLSHIYKNFHQESRNERRMARGRRIRKGLLKAMRSPRSLMSQTRRDAKQELKLSNEAHEVMHKLLLEAHSIAKGGHPNRNFYHDVDKLHTLVKKEFDKLFDEFLDAEIEENDILKRLRHIHPHTDKQKHMINHATSLLHNKLRSDVRMVRREENEINRFEHHFRDAA